MSELTYQGGELEIFAEARHWKAYSSNYIRKYLANDVLEVGAGIGSNGLLLAPKHSGRWICLEPDPSLLSEAERQLRSAGLEHRCEYVCGDLRAIDVGRQFDTIIYIDVLEHIDDDRGELAAASLKLSAGGHLVVLAPAHQQLFSAFDAAVGHYRRYSRASLRALSPPGTVLVEICYLDSVGLAASAADRLLLRKSMPSKSNIRFWDRWMVPVSMVIDRFFRYAVGKSVVAVWRKE